MPDYRVTAHSSFRDLQSQRATWDTLARGVPFLEWTWLETWWRHYGGAGQPLTAPRLLLLAVWDGTRLAGAAPWYVRRTLADGCVIRGLGSGEVCGDYMTLLAAPDEACDVAAKVAEWLHQAGSAGTPGRLRWELLELEGTLADDPALHALAKGLSLRGYVAEFETMMSCWRIELPAEWEAFVETLSKSHRKHVRRAARALEQQEYLVRRVESAAQFAAGWGTLLELHALRWQMQGAQGCFRSPRFAAFHEDYARQMLAAGRLELYWIERAGKPIAAEYQIRGGTTTYAYQAGVHPAALEEGPGRLAMIAGMQNAIARGDTAFDLLRGDEPYKAHWRAQPRELTRLRIVSNRSMARWRYRLQTAGTNMKRWLKQNWNEWMLAFGETRAV